MNLGKTFKELCTPAMVYLAISIITIFVALFNGVTIMIVAVNAIFVLFWTFILNLLCKNGMKYVSWFLVLLPYVLIFIGILMNVGNKREGASNMENIAPLPRLSPPSSYRFEKPPELREASMKEAMVRDEAMKIQEMAEREATRIEVTAREQAMRIRAKAKDDIMKIQALAAKERAAAYRVRIAGSKK